MTFTEKLQKAVQTSNSCLCVGLDPNLKRIPASIKEKYVSPKEQVFQFLKAVIDVTSVHGAAYKPNLGFFEALGAEGLNVFEQTLEYIPDEKIIIADAKRGDISSTAEHYARAYFETFDVDAVTLNPLMGFETLDPFLQNSEKAVYILTLTSNPGARNFLTQPLGNYDSMAAYIAARLADLNDKNETHLGMVIGATQPEQFTSVCNHHPKGSLLIPGIGAQGGSVKKLVSALENHNGLPLVNSSRSILYAGGDTPDWQAAVAKKAAEFKHLLKPITSRYV